MSALSIFSCNVAFDWLADAGCSLFARAFDVVLSVALLLAAVDVVDGVAFVSFVVAFASLVVVEMFIELAVAMVIAIVVDDLLFPFADSVLFAVVASLEAAVVAAAASWAWAAFVVCSGR